MRKKYPEEGDKAGSKPLWPCTGIGKLQGEKGVTMGTSRPKQEQPQKTTGKTRTRSSGKIKPEVGTE